MGYVPSLVVKWYFSYKPISSNLSLSLFLLLWMFFSTQKGVAFANSDKYVLLQFKDSVSDPEGLLSSWRAGSSDHCSWPGVSCDSRSRVVSLNITGHGGGSQNQSICYGVGKLPLYGFGIRRDCSGESGSLVGKLPYGIGKLTELRVLSLPFNGFYGEIPNNIWAMGKLEVMDLEGNSLSGLLPNWFPGLTNLRVLNLGFNKIKGGIPNSLAACLSLEILNLAGNQINGTLPGFIGRLRGVYLSFNMLQGPLPSDIGDHCDKLEHLDLSGNFFSNGIPQSLGKCGEMRSLLLYMNMLEETIPAELGQLKKLEVLDVSRNSLSGQIPVELGNCAALSVLVLSNLYNPYEDINGTKEGTSLESGLISINDDFNFYQGEIPSELTRLRKLRILWAPRATLEGKLPSDWGSCDNMEMINLGRNFFTGDIPVGLSHCKKLRLLDLSANRLTGKLVDGVDGGLAVPCMMVFDVSQNGLSGSLPTLEGTNCTDIAFEDSSLVETYSYTSAYLSFFTNKAQVGRSLLLGNGNYPVFHNFGDNNFSGGLESMMIAPERLRGRVSYAFNAGGNNLSGELPKTLFDKCDGLDAVYINVSYNSLFGKIPSEIGKLCESLKLFDASQNQISGALPYSLGDLGSLVALDLSSNLLQDRIPNSVGQMNGLKFLSLAGNQLSGIIPSSFGKLQSLELLDLSSNSLDGKIPDDLANLKNLTALLLNNNKLSGHIPSGLANITTLSVFNVSFNNLSGLLPLSNDSMKCNKVLGNPYLQPCRMFSLSVPSSDPSGSEGDSQNYAASPLGPETKSGKTGFNSIEIASIASASAIVSVLIALIALFIYTRIWHPKSKIMGTTKKEVTIFTEIGVTLTYDNVVQATGNFSSSNCIGHGGFGSTYKAEISSGVLVAIKRLILGRFQGAEQFHAEIKTLGRLDHPRLVTLIGYHASEIEMFLIYNYFPGGNLEKFIQERSTRAVDWRILHKIALDIARALHYLHDQCVPRVLHRDVKPSNILLDDEYNAYLSDFGLARLLGTSETHATTGVAGTFGYVAPEYAMTCRVSDKADVYSYGVVLLELLSDKKALDPSFSSYGNGFNIVQWACMLLRQGRAKESFAAGLWDTGPHDDLVEVLHLAVMCTVDSLSTRPTMKQVVRRLKQLQPASC